MGRQPSFADDKL